MLVVWKRWTNNTGYSSSRFSIDMLGMTGVGSVSRRDGLTVLGVSALMLGITVDGRSGLARD